jgi:hypothetical protein
MTTPPLPARARPSPGPGASPVHFGAGFRLRRILVAGGWILLPVLLLLGARNRSALDLVSAAFLATALWPVTTRSGEILWSRPGISVRRYFRYVELAPDRVEAAVVTPPVFRRQSLVLCLRRPLHFSRYVYCRLSPGSICDAWALVHLKEWERPGGRS